MKPRSPRWMRVLLVLSLALNLLIVGVVAGAVASGKTGGPRAGDVSFGPYSAALSREDQRMLRRAIRQDGKRTDWAEARANFQTFLSVLRTEPLDEGEMRRLFQEQGEMARARQDIGKTALLERIVEMSPQDRAAFADRLEEVLRRGPRDRS